MESAEDWVSKLLELKNNTSPEGEARSANEKRFDN
jgi:hypothetical protein